MATFYILPPRECLEQSVAAFVERLVPGLPAPASWLDDLLHGLTANQPGVYLLHREDLSGGDAATELIDGFGAEPGDEVVEVGLSVGGRMPSVRRWSLPAPVFAGGSP
jgi:hypothetical protein